MTRLQLGQHTSQKSHRMAPQPGVEHIFIHVVHPMILHRPHSREQFSQCNRLQHFDSGSVQYRLTHPSIVQPQMHLHNGIYFVITCATSYGSDVEVEICTTSSPHLFFCIDKKSFFLFCWTWFDLKATGFFSRYDDHRRKKKDFHISKNSADTKKMDPHLFDAARASFFARNHTSFLTAGFQSLLTTYLPQIIQQHCTITTLINGLLYTYSITNIKAYNSGITPSHCFRHILSQRVPMVGDFKLTVAPLLADLQTHKPVVMSKVRGVVFLQPICTGATLLTTPVTLDKEILNQTLPDGILISRGKMRTIP
jgi:hypothetical protein